MVALTGDFGQIMPHLWWVIGYATVIMTIAIVIFRQKMKNATM